MRLICLIANYLNQHTFSPAAVEFAVDSIFDVLLMNPRRSGTSNQRCSVSDFNRRILQIKYQTKSDNPVIKRNARLRFDSHLKEGIRIDSSVVLQNPTHAHGPQFDRDR